MNRSGSRGARLMNKEIAKKYISVTKSGPTTVTLDVNKIIDQLICDLWELIKKNNRIKFIMIYKEG